jgi:glycosyltransferase involved in cell wall biosynthesis
MRIAVLTHYFPPEAGAPQTRLFELARRFVQAGDEVTVLTGLPNYPTGVVPVAYRGHFAFEERMEGVRVLRRWVYATPNSGFLRRILNHLSFALTSVTAARDLGPVDVLLVESPPLLIGLGAFALSWLKRAPYVLNVSDIWPQSAIELGMLQNRAAVALAEALERRMYRSAAYVTVPTPGMVETLVARGFSRDRIRLVTNGVDTDVFRPGPRDAALAERLGLDGQKVFLYAGTHGISQGLDVILGAARLTTDPDVRFVLAGEGAEKPALMARASEDGIANVTFLPNQPKDVMPALLNLAYATIIPLRPLELFRSAMPSKMFESMAAGRPVVASLDGEAADLVRRSGCGVVTAPRDAHDLASAVKRLAADPESVRNMGSAGRAYVVEHFNRATIAGQLSQLLYDAARSSR